MKKKTIVIGGNGFIGSNLIEYLLSNQIKTRSIDKFPPANNLQANSNDFDFIQCDITDTDQLINSIGDFENIVWLVHTSVPSNSMLDLSADLFNNLDPLIKFLLRIKEIPNIEKFVFISSGGAIYGEPTVNKPITEQHPINPISNYGLTKYTQERYIHLILSQSHITTYILRPSNVYGPNQNLNKPQGIIGHAFKAALNNNPLTIFNHGNIIRDFIFVDDLSDAIHKCILSNNTSQITSYNIGSGIGLSINDVVNEIEKTTNLLINKNSKPFRSFDCNYNVLDNSKFSETFKWVPKISFSDGIKCVYNWILKLND